MHVRLEAIKFNLGLHTQGVGSLPIRRNENQTVTLPEWRTDSCSSPECAPAAYARTGLKIPIVIQAKFSSSDLRDQEVEIQAMAPVGDVLGPVEKTVVRFDGKGQSEFVPFNVPSPRFSQVGIKASSTKWEWQVSNSAREWLTFQETNHRIYCILDQPTDPWDKNLPWMEVLEVACEWAKGAQDLDPAAAEITQKVFDLGTNQVVGYHRSCTYANKTFDCTALLKLLKNGVGEPQKINCDDCATIVSTFANIVGCNLWQSGMSGPIATKCILMIGAKEFARPTFPRHAVAWKNKCEVKDKLFDACLAFQSDGQSGSMGHELPRDLVFFESRNRQSYKSRLVSAGNCEPNPACERHRRQLGYSYFGSRRFTSPEFLAFLKKEYEFDKWREASSVLTEPGLILQIQPLLASHSAFTGLRLRSEKAREVDDLDAVIEFLLAPPEVQLQRLIGISLYQCGAKISSSDFLLQLLGQFHATDLTRIDTPIGDVAFQEPDETAVVFKRGQVAVCVRSLGKDAVSTIELAKAINQSLTILGS